jgi:hypothetical protein
LLDVLASCSACSNLALILRKAVVKSLLLLLHEDGDDVRGEAVR